MLLFFGPLTLWTMFMFSGTKSVRVPVPCVSQNLPHAKKTYPAHEDPQLRETTHVWQGHITKLVQFKNTYINVWEKTIIVSQNITNHYKCQESCLCSVANPSRNGTHSKCTYWPTSRVSETASQCWKLFMYQFILTYVNIIILLAF